jgi:hypothetical protein
MGKRSKSSENAANQAIFERARDYVDSKKKLAMAKKSSRSRTPKTKSGGKKKGEKRTRKTGFGPEFIQN